MPPADPLVSRVLGLLLPLGPVEARRLFGGHGLYLDGVIFALAFGDTLFLKADAKTTGDFERRGLGPITYQGRHGKMIALPYWEIPADLLEDGEALCSWARKAHAAARRFEARKKPAPAASTPRERKAPASLLRPGRGPRFEPDF